MPRVAQIISTARYLPEHVVTNAELTARFDVLGKPAVIEETRGSHRHHPAFFWSGRVRRIELHQISLSWRRQRRSYEQDGSQKTYGLDYCGYTASPDHIAPSTSVVLQHKLGAKNAGTFDVNCACAAFRPWSPLAPA